jgi:UDP-N-acetylmuramoylalanine--D-glutamate ligase
MIFNLDYFASKDVIFIGRGKEGKSFETFITANANIGTFSYVDQTDGPDYLGKLTDLNLENTIVVKTPGCPGSKVPVPYTTPTRVFFDCVKQLGAKTVGVTGTKGKTTTTSMLGFMLKNGGLDVRLCGNMGLPMLDALKDSTPASIFVIELSSFQLAELTQSPDIAILTNLFRDHIDYHGSIDAYWESKRNIMRYMDENGAFIYNPTTDFALHWIANTKAKAVAINPDEVVDMSKTKLIGDHNRLNFLMARTAAELLGVERHITTLSLNEFEPVRHRLQPVKTVRGITFVDDAIGSNPEATIAGIEALIKNRGPVGCVMLGGVDREYDYSELVRIISRVGIPKLVLFPDTGAIIKSLLPETYTPEIFETKNMKEAVTWAAEHTPSGSICLLSTAAPSTVLWSNFEEKGSLFQQAVMEIPS